MIAMAAECPKYNGGLANQCSSLGMDEGLHPNIWMGVIT